MSAANFQTSRMSEEMINKRKMVQNYRKAPGLTEIVLSIVSNLDYKYGQIGHMIS